ncbi:major coat protein [Acidianus two-tailed virus 2]|nr:major coat protein [Acidianus two-tailed virus 2]
MAKYEPKKGDYAGGAVKILDMFENGQLGYPETTLKLAGEEANATRAGDAKTRDVIHAIVKTIADAMKPYRNKGSGFQSQPIPGEVIAQVTANPEYQQAKAFLASPATQARNIEREQVLSKGAKQLARMMAS